MLSVTSIYKYKIQNKFIQHKIFTTMFIAYKQNKHENITYIDKLEFLIPLSKGHSI